MITRACISINNRCNLKCTYCHFYEKKESICENNMDIIKILDNIISYIEKNNIDEFKLGFVGNGEPLLDYENLKKYILYLKNYPQIKTYTITNGTLITKEMLLFFKENNVNVGFSLDGPKFIHNPYRCNTFDKVMENVNLYFNINNKYPSFNATVGSKTLEHQNEVIEFFKQFNSKITFSRMIGKYGILLNDFHKFLEKAETTLYIRRGGYDCTMYGGLCGAGINNIFYANGNIYLCGNCIDMKPIANSNTSLESLDICIKDFDRTKCYKEIIGGI